MKKEFTKEEKKAYFQSLRDSWSAAKKIAMNGERAEIEAIIKNHGLNISVIGFCMIAHQMKAQGLDGLPYLDAKTFMGWKENGFMVMKGQKSTLRGITWIGIEPSKEDSAEIETEGKHGYAMPKEYHLFHRSQVEAIQ